MSPLGQKQTFQCVCAMSALPPKVDIQLAWGAIYRPPKLGSACTRVIGGSSRSIRMGWRRALLGKSRIETPKSVARFERRHRKDGAPIDPSPWWATNEGEKVRG